MFAESADMPVLTILQQPISTPTILNIFTPLYVTSQPSYMVTAQHTFLHIITPEIKSNLDIKIDFIKHQHHFVMFMKNV